MSPGPEIKFVGQRIKAIVFDLDGTLYVSGAFEQAVWQSVSRYAGELLGIGAIEGGNKLKEKREQLTAQRGTVQTLASAIQEMGGTVKEMHRRFAVELEPELFVEPDPRVAQLLVDLGKVCRCWLLTNNNRVLTDKILSILGISGSFEQVVTIDDTWRPKPDESVLDELFAKLALPPEAVLFVGDRYDIDLRLPERHGSPVLLVHTVDELLWKIKDLMSPPQ